jgi:hypothetical protein
MYTHTLPTPCSCRTHQVLTGQLFSPAYGMFLEMEDSRAVWFNPASLETKVS